MRVSPCQAGSNPCLFQMVIIPDINNAKEIIIHFTILNLKCRAYFALNKQISNFSKYFAKISWDVNF